MTRLHAQLAYAFAKLTYRRMAERHYFAGMNYSVNDNGFW